MQLIVSTTIYVHFPSDILPGMVSCLHARLSHLIKSRAVASCSYSMLFFRLLCIDGFLKFVETTLKQILSGRG